MLLVLDDNLNRLANFEEIVGEVEGWSMKSWVNAWSMITDLDHHVPGAALISLDHDLYRQSENDPDPGSGRDVAEYLAACDPVCPVIVHSTNTDAAWGMFNSLSAARWEVELVHHLDQKGWVRDLWLPVVLRLIERSGPHGSMEPTP